MRFSRRGLVGLALGGAAAASLRPARALLSELRGSDDIVPVEVAATPVTALRPAEPDRTIFGALRFRSGLVLSSKYSGFGGWSALWRSPDGARLVSVCDNAQWLTAKVAYDGEGRLTGLSDAVEAPVLGQDGRPLRHTAAYDTESLAIADGVAYVGIERVHEVRSFDWERSGVRARGVRIAAPDDVRGLPGNESFEAVGVLPPGHSLAGQVIAIAERSRSGDDSPTRGWVLTGQRRFAFDVARSNGFDITDVAFLPSGEALLLERRFKLVSGVACRIRRIPADAFGPDKVVDGPVIFAAERDHEIDNMEGIATHRDPLTGATVVTLISDDNFSFLQRTLLLEFTLNG